MTLSSSQPALSDLCPTERLIVLALRLKPGQTAEEIRVATGTRSLTQLKSAIRTLRLIRMIDDVEGQLTLTEVL